MPSGYAPCPVEMGAAPLMNGTFAECPSQGHGISE